MKARGVPPRHKHSYDHHDHLVRGLYVRVGAKTKTFMLTVRKGDQRRRVKLGTYPTFPYPRYERRPAISWPRRGSTSQPPAALTFADARDRFYQLHVPTMRPGSQQQARRLLDAHFSRLAKRRLPDLKTSELTTILDAIKAPVEKRNTFVWLQTFLNWSYRRGYLDQNPIARLRGMGRSTSRDRVLSDAELVSVWNAAPMSDYGALVRLLILTGQRKGQWLAFQPEFITG